MSKFSNDAQLKVLAGMQTGAAGTEKVPAILLLVFHTAKNVSE